jgi:DNA-binding LytR/AlgR family response regulator
MKFSDAVRTIDSLSRDFLKVHRSYVVSLAHIRKVNSGEILMDNGDTIPVARGKAGEVRERLFEFIRRTGR